METALVPYRFTENVLHTIQKKTREKKYYIKITQVSRKSEQKTWTQRQMQYDTP